MTDRTHTFPHPLLRLEATADEQTIVAALPSGREKTLVTAETNPLTGGIDGIMTSDTGQAFALKSTDKIADNSITTALLLTTAAIEHKSVIGGPTKPVGAPGTNSDPAASVNTLQGLPWSNDVSYPAGEADVSTIVGGYDHVCNQIAGTVIGGGHNYLQYNSYGHGTIVGGSNNRNYGGRGAIVGGLNNTLGGVAAATLGGVSNTIIASYCGFIGGYNNAIADNTAEFSGGLAGRDHTINALYSVTLGGRGGTVALGHDYAAVMGQDGVSECAGAFVQAKGKFVKSGDCQRASLVYGRRTTDATLTNMAVYGSSGLWQLAAEKTAVAFTARLVATDEATGNIAIYTFDGGAKWDGVSSATVFSAGGSGATRDFVQIVDQIGVVALPHMSCSSGALRPKVTGKAATTIKWVCDLSAAVTRI